MTVECFPFLYIYLTNVREQERGQRGKGAVKCCVWDRTQPWHEVMEICTRSSQEDQALFQQAAALDTVSYTTTKQKQQQGIKPNQNEGTRGKKVG